MSRAEATTLISGNARVRAAADVPINIPVYLSQDPTLTLADRYVYGVLLKYVEIGERTGQGAFPGLETIARECGISVASALRALKRLRQRRWVARRRRGLGLTNVYALYGPADDDETRGAAPDDGQKWQAADSATAPIPEVAESPLLEVAAAAAPEVASPAHNHDEREYDEHEQIPPVIPPRGERVARSFASRSNAPVSISPQSAHPIHRRRHAELDHPYWQDERRRGLATRWLQAYPRKEDPEGAYRAWREVLGDADSDQAVMAAFGRVCRLRWDDWQQTPPHKIPTPATWLRRREWEHPELVGSVPRPPEAPPRPRYVSQADLNAARGKLVV